MFSFTMCSETVELTVLPQIETLTQIKSFFWKFFLWKTCKTDKTDTKYVPDGMLGFKNEIGVS